MVGKKKKKKKTEKYAFKSTASNHIYVFRKKANTELVGKTISKFDPFKRQHVEFKCVLLKNALKKKKEINTAAPVKESVKKVVKKSALAK